MDQPITSSLPRTTSRPSTPPRLEVRHLAGLFGLGVTLAGIHQGFDLKAGLPGHFGLLWMAGLAWARLGSPLRWAAVVAALGYAGGGAAFSGLEQHTLLQAPLYGLTALALDLAWRLAGARLERVPVAALAGGAAFALKALAVVVLAATVGIEAGALRHGTWFPVLTHFCFGLTGAVIGTLAFRYARRRD